MQPKHEIMVYAKHAKIKITLPRRNNRCQPTLTKNGWTDGKVGEEVGYRNAREKILMILGPHCR